MNNTQYYVDLKISSASLINENTLMGEVFFRLHKALVEVGHGEIGVSFPAAKITLGNQLRLHGNQTSLTRLLSRNWLQKLEEYVSLSSLKEIPKNIDYYTVKRVQCKSSAERIRRRFVRKGWLTEKEAQEKAIKEQKIDLPFIKVKSQSTGQEFRIFIEQKRNEKPVIGKFSGYGLSSTTTIPWF